jgi:hypothetical protein
VGLRRSERETLTKITSRERVTKTPANRRGKEPAEGAITTPLPTIPAEVSTSKSVMQI